MRKTEFKKLWRMFTIFFRIGAFTIGGGYAMLPLIEREVVENEQWVTREEIIDVFAVSQSLPGVIAINSSMFIGYKIAGIPGLIMASLGVILPSFLSILAIAFVLIKIRDNIYISKAFTGIRSGVTALIALTAIKLGQATIKDKFGFLVAVIAFVSIVVFDIHAYWMILFGALAGFIRLFRNSGEKG